MYQVKGKNKKSKKKAAKTHIKNFLQYNTNEVNFLALADKVSNWYEYKINCVSLGTASSLCLQRLRQVIHKVVAQFSDAAKLVHFILSVCFTNCISLFWAAVR